MASSRAFDAASCCEMNTFIFDPCRPRWSSQPHEPTPPSTGASAGTRLDRADVKAGVRRGSKLLESVVVWPNHSTESSVVQTDGHNDMTLALSGCQLEVVGE